MFNWVWIAEVTPLTYPNWVDVTEDTAIFPEPFEIKARLAVKSEVFTVEIAPDRSDKPTFNVEYNTFPNGNQSTIYIRDMTKEAYGYINIENGAKISLSITQGINSSYTALLLG